MMEMRRLGEEMIEHMKFFRQLGVTLVASATPKAAIASPKNLPAPSAEKAGPCALESNLFPAPGFAPEELSAIRADIGDCRRCKLASSRRNIVFGAGNPHADLMFIGEAPGADEDEQGLPFVGAAGQLLTKIIQAIHMTREQVYICNILKCRPPGNRNPEPDEIAACRNFLFRQIASVRPRVICALGAYGAHTLLGTNTPISRLRGNFIDFQGAKLMATFHPSYLLRNPAEKRKVWEDVQKIRDYLLQFPSDCIPSEPAGTK
jgi:DNA polymerase